MNSPNIMLPDSHVIYKKKIETHDVFSITLDIEKKRQDFLPGQFNMLYVPGHGEVPISFSGRNKKGGIIHTIRRTGAVTDKIFTLRRGDSIGVRGPFGRGWPMDSAKSKDVILVAGGIGLAPLRPVIHEIMDNRDRYEKLILLYGTRTPDDILFEKEVHDWLARFDIDVILSVDRSVPGWHGHAGVIPNFIQGTDFNPENACAMICGPEIMMNFSVKALISRGMKPSDIYISMERNMKCAVGHCGHCQYGPYFVCKDGPVFSFPEVSNMIGFKEI